MKRFLLISLSVLMSLSVGAQLKSGLDLNLRDEKTGEWLISLFDDFAVFDCQYWQYTEVSPTRLVLSNGKRTMTVQMKKNATVIDGVKHKTSVLTSTFLPDYPVKDETDFSHDILPKEKKTTVHVFTRTRRPWLSVFYFVNNIMSPFDLGQYCALDSLGRAEIELNLAATARMRIQLPHVHDILKRGDQSADLHILLTPGQRIMVFIDDVNQRIYAMGDNARITNELASCCFPVERTFRLGFCKRSRQMMQADARYQYLNALILKAVYQHDPETMKILQQTLTPEDLHPSVPFGVLPNIREFLTDRLLHQESSLPPFFNNPAYSHLNDFQQNILYSITKVKGGLDSLSLTYPNREILMRLQGLNYLEQLYEPVSDEFMDVLRSEIKDSILWAEIESRQQELIETSNRARSIDSIYLGNASVVEGMTDGVEILKKLAAPYRGSYVYIILWDPFKLALEVQNYFTYLNQLPTAFGDKKVTCLFICNSSNDWRWRYNMAYFNMFGDNYIHYRLTGKEKDAIGQSFDLGRSVSYRLITPGGQLLPAEVPSPRNYINLKRMLDEL